MSSEKNVKREIKLKQYKAFDTYEQREKRETLYKAFDTWASETKLECESKQLSNIKAFNTIIYIIWATDKRKQKGLDTLRN
jgi:hypothetical protein